MAGAFTGNEEKYKELYEADAKEAKWARMKKEVKFTLSELKKWINIFEQRLDKTVKRADQNTFVSQGDINELLDLNSKMRKAMKLLSVWESPFRK